MSKQSMSSFLVALGLAFGCLAIAGCHGNANSSSAPEGMISQAPNTPQIQAKLQAQLNNPRVSPRMKQALQLHLQQSQGSGH